MNNKDLISIIIPVYNTEKYLEECLDSVVGQTYRDIEIIIVDDCSTDNSFNICKKYANKFKNIILINKDINEGVARARNTGLKAAKGEYIYFLDSDDLLAKNAMEILHKEITKNNCDIVLFRSTSNIEKIYNDYNYSISILDNYQLLRSLVYMNIHQAPWDKLYRKKIFDDNNIQFFDMRYYEDGPTTAKILINTSNAVMVNTNLHYYRIVCSSIRHTSQTTNHRKDYLKNRIEIFNLIKTCQYDDIKIKSLNNTLASIVKVYYYLAFVDNKENYKQCAKDYYHTFKDLIIENKEIYKKMSLKYRFFYFWFKYFPRTISLVLHEVLKDRFTRDNGYMQNIEFNYKD